MNIIDGFHSHSKQQQQQHNKYTMAGTDTELASSFRQKVNFMRLWKPGSGPSVSSFMLCLSLLIYYS